MASRIFHLFTHVGINNICIISTKRSQSIIAWAYSVSCLWDYRNTPAIWASKISSWHSNGFTKIFIISVAIINELQSLAIVQVRLFDEMTWYQFFCWTNWSEVNFIRWRFCPLSHTIGKFSEIICKCNRYERFLIESMGVEREGERRRSFQYVRPRWVVPMISYAL